MARIARREGVLIIIALLVTLVILLFNWNMLRGPVEWLVSKQTGRTFEINGDLDVDLSWTPRIELNRIELGNAEWSKDPVMARLEQLALRISLSQLFRGDVVFPEIVLIKPLLLLERNDQNQVNWKFKEEEPKKDEPPPTIGNFVVEEGVVRYRDPLYETDVTAQVSTSIPAAGERQMLNVAAQGTYRKEEFSMTGKGATVLSMRDLQDPYPLEIHARAGVTRAGVKGTIADPLTFQGLSLDAHFEGPDLSKLYPLVPVPLPSTPPYKLRGHLTRKGDVWSFANFFGGVGDSDLSGDFTIDLSTARPRLIGDLASRKLDFNDLGALVGAPPGTGKGETASAEQKRAAVERAASTRVLPDRPFSLGRLRVADANVKFRGERVITRKLPVESLRAHLILENGKLTLKPLNFGVAQGTLASTIVLDARANPIKTSADVNIRNLNIKELFTNVQLKQVSAGRLGGRIRIETNGNSVAKMLANADGEMAIVMAGGSISNLVLELLDIDVAEAVRLLLGGDEKVRVRCLIGAFDLKDGVMESQALVLDTQDTKVVGEGTVNFDNETLDFTLRARPKDMSLAALRGPIGIQGRFKGLDINPHLGQAAARGGAAVALGVLLGPVAALLPLVEFGNEENVDCRSLISQVNQDVKTPGKGTIKVEDEGDKGQRPAPIKKHSGPKLFGG